MGRVEAGLRLVLDCRLAVDTRPVTARRHRDWIAAFTAGDVDAHAKLVTQDMVWMPPHGVVVVGRDAPTHEGRYFILWRPEEGRWRIERDVDLWSLRGESAGEGS